MGAILFRPRAGEHRGGNQIPVGEGFFPFDPGDGMARQIRMAARANSHLHHASDWPYLGVMRRKSFHKMHCPIARTLDRAMHLVEAFPAHDAKVWPVTCMMQVTIRACSHAD